MCLVFSNTIKQIHSSSLAQSVEQSAVNRCVAGSSPAGGAKKRHPKGCLFFYKTLKLTHSPRFIEAV